MQRQDSRLRGNDGGVYGNDVGGSGNDGEVYTGMTWEGVGMTSGDASWGQSKQRQDSRLRRHLHNLLCWGINRGARSRKSQGEWNHREMSQPSLAESLLP